MTELEKKEFSTAVAVGLARTFFPSDREMLHLLGLLQTAKPGSDFEIALKHVRVYGDGRRSGFGALIDRRIAATLQEIEDARKLTLAAQ